MGIGCDYVVDRLVPDDRLPDSHCPFGERRRDDDVGSARREGLPITVETCPHYLHFSAEDVPDEQHSSSAHRRFESLITEKHFGMDCNAA